MSRAVLFAVAILLALAAPGRARRVRCPPDAVPVGPLCVDRYEASVWSIPPDNAGLITRVRNGKADAGDLAAGDAVQLGAIPMDGCSGFDYGAGFPPNGNWTAPVYAASVAGVPPSTCISWFQAAQACRLAGKRLLTNEEWQSAAAGTPDPGTTDDVTTTCATQSPFAALTGARTACVSAWGTHDMVGNVWEWVAGWVNAAEGCTYWDAEHGGDLSCMGLAPTPTSGFGSTRELVTFDPNLPGAVIRGGNYAVGDRNGVFAVYAGVNPSNISRSTGFRCGR